MIEVYLKDANFKDGEQCVKNVKNAFIGGCVATLSAPLIYNLAIKKPKAKNVALKTIGITAGTALVSLFAFPIVANKTSSCEIVGENK